MQAAAKNLAEFTVSNSFDLDEVEACLRRNGVAVLADFASAQTVESLSKEFFKALDDHNQEYVYQISYQPGRAVSLMRDRLPHRLYPEIQAFFGAEKMQKLCDRYVGHPQFMNYEVYATHEFRPQVEIAPTHFDKLWTLKYMLYLNDISAENGAFGVIPGSHIRGRQIFRNLFDKHNLQRLEMSDERYDGMGNDKAHADMPPVVDIVGKAGTMIVFDSDTFHHAGVVSAGRERMILRAHTGPAVQYKSVRKGSRQWWRGERRFSKFDALVDRIADSIL